MLNYVYFYKYDGQNVNRLKCMIALSHYIFD